MNRASQSNSVAHEMSQPLPAKMAVELEFPRGDPFDRVIAATAKVHGIPLLTRDRSITDSGVVEIIW